MMPDLDKLSKLAKVSCKFVIFCIFFPRRRSRTLVQNSVPGGTTIFVVGSDLKYFENKTGPPFRFRFRNFMHHKFQFENEMGSPFRSPKTKTKRGPHFVFVFGERNGPPVSSSLPALLMVHINYLIFKTKSTVGEYSSRISASLQPF